MKIVSSIILFVLFTLPILAQQDAQFTTFFFNKLAYNPAYAGSKEVLNLNATYRHQWAGMEGAPRTINVAMNAPFFNKRCGLGISLQSDRIGLMDKTSLDISYAYRLPITKDNILSFGLNASMEYGQIRWDQSIVSDEGDEMIPESDQATISPNFGLGVYYSNPNMYLGFSAPNIFNSTTFNYGTNTGEYKANSQTYYLMAGWIKRLNRSLVFKPGMLLSYVPNVPMAVEVNASMIFMDVLWVGGSYRLGDSFDAIVQYQFNQQLKAGIAADLTNSELNNYTTGSLEFLVEYNFVFQPNRKDHLRFF